MKKYQTRTQIGGLGYTTTEAVDTVTHHPEGNSSIAFYQKGYLKPKCSDAFKLRKIAKPKPVN